MLFDRKRQAGVRFATSCLRSRSVSNGANVASQVRTVSGVKMKPRSMNISARSRRLNL
jgi:hypothetical protein